MADFNRSHDDIPMKIAPEEEQIVGSWIFHDSTGKLVAPYNYGAELFSITPYFRKGEFEGYRIYPGANASQFAANGLESGDLLTMIDGDRVTLCSSAISDRFESLRSGNMISITVHRGRDFAEMDFNLSFLQ